MIEVVTIANQVPAQQKVLKNQRMASQGFNSFS